MLARFYRRYDALSFGLLWVLPVILGVKLLKRKGYSPHWMWFGIHPLFAWIVLAIAFFLADRAMVEHYARLATRHVAPTSPELTSAPTQAGPQIVVMKNHCPACGSSEVRAASSEEIRARAKAYRTSRFHVLQPRSCSACGFFWEPVAPWWVLVVGSLVGALLLLMSGEGLVQFANTPSTPRTDFTSPDPKVAHLVLIIILFVTGISTLVGSLRRMWRRTGGTPMLNEETTKLQGKPPGLTKA